MAAEPQEDVILVSVNIQYNSLMHIHSTYKPHKNERTKNDSYMHIL